MTNERERAHPGIVDVARLAGVSPATVSRSLRGLPNVAEATRSRVRAAASELSYVVSPAAAGLATGRTTTIGVVVPFVSRWFFSRVIAGAGEVLRQHGYDLVLHNLGGAEARDTFFERMPLRRRVDAVLVVSLPLTPAEVSALVDLQVPVVTVGVKVERFPCVRIDDLQAAKRGVTYLRNLGHERVAMISALDDADLGFGTSRRRRAGHRSALERDMPPDLVVGGTWGLDGGARAMEEILSWEPLPTAVFVEYDEMAFGALRTLRRAGLDVPADVSVMGFDDHEMADVVDLSTVSQPVLEQGSIAASMLMDLLHDRGVEPDIELATHVVVRGSTAPPRRRLNRVDPGLRAGAGA